MSTSNFSSGKSDDSSSEGSQNLGRARENDIIESYPRTIKESDIDLVSKIHHILETEKESIYEKILDQSSIEEEEIRNNSCYFLYAILNFITQPLGSGGMKSHFRDTNFDLTLSNALEMTRKKCSFSGVPDDFITIVNTIVETEKVLKEEIFDIISKHIEESSTKGSKEDKIKKTKEYFGEEINALFKFIYSTLRSQLTEDERERLNFDDKELASFRDRLETQQQPQKTSFTKWSPVEKKSLDAGEENIENSPDQNLEVKVMKEDLMKLSEDEFIRRVAEQLEDISNSPEKRYLSSEQYNDILYEYQSAELQGRLNNPEETDEFRQELLQKHKIPPTPQFLLNKEVLDKFHKLMTDRTLGSEG